MTVDPTTGLLMARGAQQSGSSVITAAQVGGTGGERKTNISIYITTVLVVPVYASAPHAAQCPCWLADDVWAVMRRQ
jgi:hypothetical protein